MNLPAIDEPTGTTGASGTAPLQSLVVVPAVSSLVGTLMAVGVTAAIVGVLLGISGRRVSRRAARNRTGR